MTDTQESSNTVRLSSADSRRLKTLKIEQRQLKATLTRFETLLESNPDPELVAHRLRRVDGTMSAYEAAQRGIDALKDVPDDDDSEIAVFEEKYDRLIVKAARYLRRTSISVSGHTTVVAESAYPSVGADSPSDVPQLPTKLPAISMPTFAGNHLEWETFRDMFVSLVHSNAHLTNLQRFYYLKSSLRGEALVVLDNYTITEANYTEAWQKLQDRYANQRVLLNNHWRAFSTLTPVVKESATALKHLFSGIARMDHALQSLDRESSAWEDWLVHFAVDRLDATTRRDWEQSLGKDAVPPTFEALNSFVEGRIQALESFPPPPRKEPRPPDIN